MLRGVEGGLEGSRTKTRAHRKKQATTISGREMALRPPAAGARRPSSVGKGRWSHKGPLPNQFGGEVVRQGEKKVPAVVPTAPRHAAVRHSGRFFSLLSPICGTRSTLCVNSVRRPRLQGPGDTGQEGKPPSPQPFVWCYRATAWGGGSGNGGAVRSLAHHVGTQDGDPSGWVGCFCLPVPLCRFLSLGAGAGAGDGDHAGAS